MSLNAAWSFTHPFFPSNHHHHPPPHRASSAFRASLIFMSIQLLTLCIHTAEQRTKPLKVVKHGWCPWMFQLWRLCVVFSCCCACPVCRHLYLHPSPLTFLLFSVVRC